jgi:hypothetical protein
VLIKAPMSRVDLCGRRQRLDQRSFGRNQTSNRQPVLTKIPWLLLRTTFRRRYGARR